MSDLAPQKINLSFGGLLQVPGGLTSSLQYITDGNGVNSGVQISTTGFSGTIVSDTVTITGGTINGTAIGATNPSSGKFSSLTAGSLSGILKGTSGLVGLAVSGTDYAPATSGTAILKGNGSGGFSSAVSGTDYAPATSGTSILKGNGSGGFAVAVSGTDYAPATSGTSILYGNGSGGFSNVTVGSGLSFAGGTLSSTSSGGSVTTVSVVSANGFAGTVANASSTPAITLTTSVTGLLKGNGTAISAATAGTDYQAAITATGILKGAGAGSVSAAVSGTDYAPATSGTSILKGDGAGGFSAAVAGTDYAGLASANTFTNDQIISVSSASDALRITQTGAGNALLVEDSANPDSTPFVVDSTGNIGQGLTSVTTTGFTGGYISKSSTAYGPQLVYENATNDASGPYYLLQKGRSGAIVQSGDWLGNILFRGFDGTNFIRGASIEGMVDGTPGTNDMPGRLVFSTTADGASSPTERMRIDNAGLVGIGTTPSAGRKVLVGGNIAGSANAYAYIFEGSFGSDVTGTAAAFGSSISTVDAATGPSNVTHFSTYQGAISGGSRTTPTNQYGFLASSTLTGATNNYGFYSNIASGTGRYNFYAAGTAANYFAGDVTINGNTTVKNYTETTYSANSSTAITLSLANGTQQYITLTGSPTITMPTAAAGKSFTLILYTGSGSYTVSWSTVAWAGGTTPTVTTTASKKDIFNFYSDGTNWYGSIFGQSF